jgi:hypothetical protein
LKNKHPNDKQRLFEKITNLFISLFIDDILDIKSLEKVEDLCDKDKICKKRRKVREHQEYLQIFLNTATYDSMLKYIGPHPQAEINTDGINVLEFLKERKRKGASGEKRERNIEIVTSRDPESVEYSKLSKMYEEADLISPILPCNEDEGDWYKYKFFPKLMDNLMLDQDEIQRINWPAEIIEIDDTKPTLSIFEPEVKYNYANINLMTWIVASLSAYRYHQHWEKIVHVTEWIHQLSKFMRLLDKSHWKIIIEHAIEIIRIFGDLKTIAGNMSYIIQNIQPFKYYKIDWKSLNKLSIAFKFLDSGITPEFENMVKKSLNGENKFGFADSDAIEIVKEETKDTFPTDAEFTKMMRLGSVIGSEEEIKLALAPARQVRSIRSNLTVIERKRDMHENPMYEETVNKLVKYNSSSKKMYKSPSGPIEDGKVAQWGSPRSGGNNTGNNANEDIMDIEFFEDEEVIEINQRTFERGSGKGEFQYCTTLAAKWPTWSKNFTKPEIENSIYERIKRKITLYF